MTSYNLLVNKLEVPVASFLRCFALVMLASLWCRAAAADPIADFYRGKVINLVIGYSAGGGFDLYARAVGRHLGRHIPGNPAIVPHNMPGAGSVQAALFMAGAAPQDGTAIATVAQSMALQQAMGDPSIRFDMRRFNWIGNPIQGVSTIATWRASGVHSIADAKRRDVSIGATGINVTMQYPQVLNSLIGTRFKVVIGYPGGNDIAARHGARRGRRPGPAELGLAQIRPSELAARRQGRSPGADRARQAARHLGLYGA